MEIVADCSLLEAGTESGDSVTGCTHSVAEAVGLLGVGGFLVDVFGECSCVAGCIKLLPGSDKRNGWRDNYLRMLP